MKNNSINNNNVNVSIRKDEENNILGGNDNFMTKNKQSLMKSPKNEKKIIEKGMIKMHRKNKRYSQKKNVRKHNNLSNCFDLNNKEYINGENSQEKNKNNIDNNDTKNNNFNNIKNNIIIDNKKTNNNNKRENKDNELDNKKLKDDKIEKLENNNNYIIIKKIQNNNNNEPDSNKNKDSKIIKNI